MGGGNAKTFMRTRCQSRKPSIFAPSAGEKVFMKKRAILPAILPRRFEFPPRDGRDEKVSVNLPVRMVERHPDGLALVFEDEQCSTSSREPTSSYRSAHTAMRFRICQSLMLASVESWSSE